MRKLNVLFAFFLLCTAAPAQKKPNIVFILADDLGYGDLGCYGQQKIKTPNIDRMAQEGKKFTRFYAGSTVCAPSRSVLMTGQHTGHAYVRGNGEVPLRAKDTILPQYLKQLGYTNGLFGKWGLGLKNTEGSPEKKGWDVFVGLTHHVEGHHQIHDSLWHVRNKTLGRVAMPKGTYANEVFTDSALQFIRENAQKPFFLFLSFTLPHAALDVPQKYLQRYQRPDGSSVFDHEVPLGSGNYYKEQPQPKAAYAAMVSSLDDYVGKVLEQLRQSGLDKNTLVIFTTDNGTHREGGRSDEDIFDCFQSSGPYRGFKRDLYDGGICVPLMARWPGKIAANATSTFSGMFMDLLPTFYEAAGGRPKPAWDGLSILNELKGKRQQQHCYLYWEFYEGGFFQCVVSDGWKLIRFFPEKKEPYVELYHLQEDVGERKNLATQYPEKVARLTDYINEAHTKPENVLFRKKLPG